jgi:hypothetical protein
MSYHVARIKNIVYRNTDELLGNLTSELKHANRNLVDIRECEVRLGETRLIMMRCFAQAKDSGAFVNVGWVINDHIDKCLLCRGVFTFFNRRHHCRACGTLVCRFCSQHKAYITTMEQFGAMKVCRECYRGQGESVPVLDTRHSGRSLKQQQKSDSPAGTTKSSNIDGSVPSSMPTSTTTSPNTPTRKDSTTNVAKHENNSSRDQNAIRQRADSDSSLPPPPYLLEFPLPGYVVKTCRYSTNEKVFINICHHSSVLDPMLSLFNVVLPPDDVTMQEEERCVLMNEEFRDITVAASLDSTIVPIMYLCENVDATQDKNEQSSVLYWVMISSDYFKASILKYTSVAVVQKVIEAINKTFKDSLLEDEYVRPRVNGGMKAGVRTCHPLTAITEEGVRPGVSSFPDCPVTFLAPINFVLNATDVALLLRINHSDNNRESMGDSQSVCTERTADDLELAHHEDDIAQKSFQLPPFPNVQQTKKRRSSSPTVITDTHSEMSDLTFVSYNPKQPPISKLPKKPLPSISSQALVSFNGQNQPLPVKPSGPGRVAGNENYPIHHPHKRFSWVAASNDAKFGSNGRNLVTASMLVYRKEMSLSDAEVASMIQQSTKLPAALMGWQVISCSLAHYS